MKNIIDAIKKHWAILFIFLFVCVFAVLTIPQVAHAEDWEVAIGKWNPFNKVGQLWCLVPGDWAAAGCNTAKKISTAAAKSGISSWPNPVLVAFAATALAVGVIIVSISSIFSVMASSIMNWAISITASMGCYSCMDNAIIAMGWPRVRDMANMIVFLGFVIIGIATALRMESYGAKRLFFKLIGAAILINFSLFICGLFIDGSNILSKSLLSDTDVLSKSWSQTVDEQVGIIWNEWKKSDYQEAAVGILTSAGGLVFYNIMMAVTFFLYGFLYICRIISLWILVILSPLAFVFYVFPGTQKFFNMWWSNFLNWCIIIVPISFFFWIASTLVKQFSSAPGTGTSITPLAYIIPGVFMLIGFLFSLRISAMGAGAAVSAFKWSGGKAGQLGKWASDKSGATSTASRAKGWALQRLENFGLVKPGTAALSQPAQQIGAKDRSNRVAAMTAEQMAREIENPRLGHEARLDRAAMLLQLAKNNQLGMLSPAAQQRTINEAIGLGIKPKDLVGAMSSNAVADIINSNRHDSETRAKSLQTLSERGDLNLVSLGRRQSVVNESARHGVKINDLAKSDYRWRAYDINGRVAQIGEDAAVTEQLEENIKSMSGKQLRDIDWTLLTPEFVERNLTPNMINAYKTASWAHIDHLQNTVRADLDAKSKASGVTREQYKKYKNLMDAIDKLA